MQYLLYFSCRWRFFLVHVDFSRLDESSKFKLQIKLKCDRVWLCAWKQNREKTHFKMRYIKWKLNSLHLLLFGFGNSLNDLSLARSLRSFICHLHCDVTEPNVELHLKWPLDLNRKNQWNVKWKNEPDSAHERHRTDSHMHTAYSAFSSTFEISVSKRWERLLA